MHPGLQKLLAIMQDFEPTYVGKVGELFPELAKTRKGVDLSDIPIHTRKGIASYMFTDQHPAGPKIELANQVLPPYHPLQVGSPSIDEYNLRVLIHELTHAARSRSRRSMYDPITHKAREALQSGHVTFQEASELYYRAPTERSANKAGVNVAKRLLAGKNPAWAIPITAAGASLASAGKSYAENLSSTLGIPNLHKSTPYPQLMALALSGDPGARYAVSQLVKQAVSGTIRGVGTAVTHPFEVGEAIMHKATSDPAGFAGVLTGMALPLGPKAQLRYGQKALSAAERRMDARVLRERARVHAELEGKTFRQQFQEEGARLTRELRKLGINPVGRTYTDNFLTDERLAEMGLPPERTVAYRAARDAHSKNLASVYPPEYPATAQSGESMGDWAVNAPDNTLQAVYKMNPNPTIEKELARRGLKPDISDQLHLLEEGPGGPMHSSGVIAAGQSPAGAPILGSESPDIWTREERGAEMLKGVPIPPPNAQQYARQNLVNFLNTHRPDDPLGTKVGQFIKTTKGWTFLGGE
jgi:hypothetical protein